MSSKHRNSKPRNYGGGMGMSRHYKSGKLQKSPKTRFMMSLDAKKNERKAPPSLPYDSVAEAFRRPKDGTRTE